jgi:hypothetical protein
VACPCCDGFSTSPVLYHHFRLNPLTLKGGKRAIKLRGWRCVLKSQKPVPLRYLLHYRLGNRIVLGTSEAQGKFFGQKSDPNMQFGCRAQELMHYSGFYLLSNDSGEAT